MKLSQMKKLLMTDSDPVCAKCKTPGQVWVDPETGEMPTGILCEGRVYCLECLEALGRARARLR